jgi:hypothetical protein
MMLLGSHEVSLGKSPEPDLSLEITSEVVLLGTAFRNTELAKEKF